MQHVRVLWTHNCPEDPVEIDADRWEHRKVEIWADGRKGFADANNEVGGSGLGLEPWDELEHFADSPELDAHAITRDEFERVWSARHAPSPR